MKINKLLKYWFTSSSWEGVATLSDITGSFSRRNSALNPEEADYLALLSDWKSVGDDLRTVIKLQKAD
jgi:hypothetical protein